MTSQTRFLKNVSEEHLETLVTDTVRYILGNVPLKFPVKRQEIVKNVLKDYSKSFRIVMEKARICLKRDYGIDVVEVSTSGSNKVYLLISDFQYKHLPNLRKFLPESTKSQQILLTIVASYIFMKGGSVKEDSLWDFLTRLNLYKKDRTFVHEVYGDVYKAVQDFVRQMYLDYVNVTSTDLPRHEFALGKRAELEVSYRGLLEYVCYVYGSSSMNSWHTQYQAVLQQEHRWRERSLAGGEPISTELSQHQSSQPGSSQASQLGVSQASQHGRSRASQLRSSQVSQFEQSRPGPSGYRARGASVNKVDSTGLQPSNSSQTRQRVKFTHASSKRLRKL